MVFKSRYLAKVFCDNEGISPDDYCIVRSHEISGGFEVYLRATSAIIDTYCTERRFNEEVLRHGRIRH